MKPNEAKLTKMNSNYLLYYHETVKSIYRLVNGTLTTDDFCCDYWDTVLSFIYQSINLYLYKLRTGASKIFREASINCVISLGWAELGKESSRKHYGNGGRGNPRKIGHVSVLECAKIARRRF